MIAFRVALAFIFHVSGAINFLAPHEAISCNGERRFSGFDRVIYINWPQSELTPHKCSYRVKSPVNSFITAKIYHNLSGTEPSCRSQKIVVSRDGDSRLRSASQFCGMRKSRPVEVTSIGNEMTFAVLSNISAGAVQIVLKACKTTQSNCDCSWNIGKKITGGEQYVLFNPLQKRVFPFPIGSNASPNEFIAHASFMTQVDRVSSSICGGAIISQNYILTCAHCIMAIVNVHKWNVVIAVGRHNISARPDRDTIYAESYEISGASVHKGYRPETNDNDIALVRSARHMKFNRGVGPACLPFAYENFPVPTGTILTAIGFGSTQFAVSASADRRSWILQKVQLTVNNTLPRCRNNTMRLCAIGSYNERRQVRGDSCQRDSGSGLYGYMRNRYVLFGITSEGFACGAKDSYSINVYVAKYLAWIKSTIGGGEFLCGK